MRIKRSSHVFAALALAAITFSLAVSVQAQTLKVIHNFTGKGDGGSPSGGVIFDSAGNFYGVTYAGGTSTDCTGGCGVAYRFSPTATGGWKETALFSFSHLAGAPPIGNLLRTSKGDVLGVTVTGSFGGGLVYELAPTSSVPWQESYALIFNSTTEGAIPVDGLVADSAGNLYGVASEGGNLSGCSNNGCGVVYELSPTSSGWKETTLYTFSGGADGSIPEGHLILDAAGNLYGTTAYGGSLSGHCAPLGCGTVFELSRGSSGTWTETVIHTFLGPDGYIPLSSLAMDAAGNLYGTTFDGGNHCPSAGCGVVFKLAPASSGQWQETVLHNFTGNSDGADPNSGLAIDSAGVLYGTTPYGGIATDCGGTGCGVIFKLTPATGGGFTFTRLHAFTGGADGSEVPTVNNDNAPLVFGSDGNLYGTTPAGGTLGQ